jgi:hypothetical protein
MEARVRFTTFIRLHGPSVCVAEWLRSYASCQGASTPYGLGRRFSHEKIGVDKLRKTGGCSSLQRKTLRTAIVTIAYYLSSMITYSI